MALVARVVTLIAVGIATLAAAAPASAARAARLLKTRRATVRVTLRG